MRVLAVTSGLLLVAAGLAHAQAPADAVATLRRSGELRCEPLWPQFCANVHVTCTGHTSIAARPFRVLAAGAMVHIDATPADDNVLKPYAKARVEWDPQGAYVLLSPELGNGYFKLQADGRYSIRHYVQSQGVMSIGSCR